MLEWFCVCTSKMASNPNIQKLYTSNKLSFAFYRIKVQQTNGFYNDGWNKISLVINLFYQVHQNSLYMIRDFWEYHHPVHDYSKYFENTFLIFTLGKELFHKISRKALTFSFLTFYLANDYHIYSHNLRHFF